jgi:hypothetical protein
MYECYHRWIVMYPITTFLATWFILSAIIIPPAMHLVHQSKTPAVIESPTTPAIEPKCVDSMHILRAPSNGLGAEHHTMALCPSDASAVIVQTGDPSLIYFSCHCK